MGGGGLEIGFSGLPSSKPPLHERTVFVSSLMARTFSEETRTWKHHALRLPLRRPEAFKQV